MYNLARREGDLRADQMVQPYEYLANRRMIFLYGPIAGAPTRMDPFGSSYLADTILAMSKMSSDPIYLVIDSMGGFIDDGYVLYDSMKTVRAPVYTVGRACYSMAAVILAGGESGHRYIYPNARVALHLPYGGFKGDAREIEIQASEMKRVKEAMADTLIENGVNLTRKALLQDIDREKFMGAEEAIEYGLVDNIIPKGFFHDG